HFIPVSNDQQNVRPHFAEHISQSQSCYSNGLRHSNVSIGVEQALDLCHLLFDVLRGVPENWGKMRPERDELHLRLAASLEIMQQPPQVGVVGARRGYNGNFSLSHSRRKAILLGFFP